jgi:hypothetical protein
MFPRHGTLLGTSLLRSLTVMGNPFFGRMEFSPEHSTFMPGLSVNENLRSRIESATFNCTMPSDVPIQYRGPAENGMNS